MRCLGDRRLWAHLVGKARAADAGGVRLKDVTSIMVRGAPFGGVMTHLTIRPVFGSTQTFA